MPGVGVSILALALAAPPADPTAGMSDADLLAHAECYFQAGVADRDDSRAAREWFARAARSFDELWARGQHAPAVARNAGHAHRLAGDLPRAILAYRRGLWQSPADRDLRAALADARAEVASPYARPNETWIDRAKSAAVMVPWAAVAGAYTLAWLALARWRMTRRGSWLTVALTGMLLAGAVGLLRWQTAEERRAEPAALAVVAATDAKWRELRTGNGFSYPPRLDGPLPAGVEARVLNQRGGWLQLELANGAAGWLPATAVLRPATFKPEGESSRRHPDPASG